MEPQRAASIHYDFAGFSVIMGPDRFDPTVTQQDIDDKIQELDAVEAEIDPMLWQCLDAMERKLQDIEDFNAKGKCTTDCVEVKLEEPEPDDLEDEFQAIQDAINLNQPSFVEVGYWGSYIEGPDLDERQDEVLNEFPQQYLEPYQPVGYNLNCEPAWSNYPVDYELFKESDPERHERIKRAMDAFKK